MTPNTRTLSAALAALALLAAGTSFVLADTGMGLIGDTQCRSLLVGNTDVCDEATDHRLPWVATTGAVALVLALAAVVLLVRGRRRAAADVGRPGRRVLATGVVVLAAALALGWWGALRLGEGNTDDCGSPITGAGAFPYDATRTSRCADVYDRKLVQGLLALGGGVALIVVPTGAYAVARRR